ncbi:MAG: hypothetical protein F6K42_00715 [Leptolyngbya sp. SIO1D8]|nr:hypothetical protein [Leptolyngbya sp. SIO1D8]
MAALSRSRKRRPVVKATALWFERIFALVALCNLILVLFDLSYIRFRDFYLRYLPEFTERYGEAFKGIEPERSTENYLESLENLEEQVAQTGLQSIQAETLLDTLQEQSIAMIDENPFAIANKSGTLERIKNMMRDRIGVDSAKAAFTTFWSPDYLTEAGWSQEIAYFNTEIKPLMETNYFRNIGEDGGPRDDFWKIDIWFLLFFGLEMSARTFYISRRYKNYTWIDAVLLRWYDLFLILPFWRWLRVIPVMVRLNQSQLVNLIPLRNRINRILITNFAVELTEVVVLRIFDQMQNLIREGDIARRLLESGPGQRYIDLNGVDEIQAISSRLFSLVLYQVLPQIKPEIDALLHHNVSRAFDQAPGYQGFRQLPGIGSLPDQIAQQVVGLISQNLYKAMTGVLEDQEGADLTQQLMDKFGDTVRSEIRQEQTLEELQAWTVALLEEIKINYVKQISVEDVENLMERNYQIYNITQERQKQ